MQKSFRHQLISFCSTYTRKTGFTDAHNFRMLTEKIWTVWLQLLHRLLKDIVITVVAMPAFVKIHTHHNIP